MDRISSFRGEYAFLSNFYASNICFNGKIYKTAEHFFQACKTLNKEDKLKIINANTPKEAKRLGKNVKLRKDWDRIKTFMMYNVVKLKFSQNPELKEKLLATGDLYLEEGNYWHDNFFGKCNCPKCINTVRQNHLGRILMRVRRELREK